MAFEITVDDSDLEELVEKYLQSRVAAQVGTYLETRLAGVIEAKLAAMKLAEGAPAVTEKVIRETLEKVIDSRLKALIPAAVRAEIRSKF